MTERSITSITDEVRAGIDNGGNNGAIAARFLEALAAEGYVVRKSEEPINAFVFGDLAARIERLEALHPHQPAGGVPFHAMLGRPTAVTGHGVTGVTPPYEAGNPDGLDLWTGEPMEPGKFGPFPEQRERDIAELARITETPRILLDDPLTPLHRAVGGLGIDEELADALREDHATAPVSTARIIGLLAAWVTEVRGLGFREGQQATTRQSDTGSGRVPIRDIR